MKIRHQFIKPAILFAVLGWAFTANADCTTPAGVAGDQRYDSGTQTMMFCDGTNWQSMKGNITGQLRLGDDAAACDASKEGTIRYNTATQTLQLCDGTTWTQFASTTGASADPDPNAFDFVDLTDQPLNTLVFSSILTVSGLTGPVTVQVSGAGSPKLSVNGSAFQATNQINAGDTLQIQMTTSSSTSTALQTTITIGSVTDTWTVTTRSGGTRIFVTEGTYRGDGLNGLSGADSICQAEAVQYGLSGSWKALLSDATTDTASRIALEYPVTNACNGSLVESTDIWGTTHEGGIRSASACTTGTNASWYVWTGSGSTGAAIVANTCDSWYTDMGDGRIGAAGSTNSQWINYTTSACGNFYRLYCVSQDPGPLPDSTNTPAAFSFGEVTNQNLLTSVSSGTVTLSGFTGSLTASVSGQGSPEFSVNGGAFASGSQTVPAGALIQLRLTTYAKASFTHTVTLKVGDTSGEWRVITKAAGSRMFVTAGTYAGWGLGGLTGADSICMQEAAASGYGGNWKALLSNQNTDAINRLTFVYPIVNRCSNTVIEVSDLWTSTHEGAIHSAGDCSTGTTASWYVWTGTTSSGTSATSATCESWYTNSGDGRIGVAGSTNSQWINYTTSACGTFYRLYCVSQPDTPTPNPANTPSAFSFTNLTGQELRTQITSGTATLSGFTGSVTVSATGAGSPEVSINGGAFSSSPQSAVSGDTVQVRVFTVTRASFKHSVTISASATSTVWEVTTKPPGTRIFVTINTYTGSATGGLAGADSICTTEAAAQGYGGTWKALMSDAVTNAKDRVTLAYPIVNRCSDGVVEVSDIWGSDHEDSIYTAGSCSTGTSASWYVWTGTLADGTKAAETCTSWTATTSGRIGVSGSTNSQWITYTSTAGSSAYRIYCVSQ